MEPKIQSVHCILLNGGKYILQLRDDKPDIAAPNQWSLFGGMKREDETSLEAIKREIKEELMIEPQELQYLWFVDYFADFKKEIIRTWFYVSDITDIWNNHRLTEGQLARPFTFEQLAELVMPLVMRQTISRYNNSLCQSVR